MASAQVTTIPEYLHRAREVFIHVGVLFLLVMACFYVLMPFLPMIAWGIIIAIAIYPGYRRLHTFFGGKRILSSAICTVLLLAAVIVPIVLLGGTLVDGIQTLTSRVKEGTQIIPPPPAGIESWPVVGVPLREIWSLASTNLSAALRTLAPHIKAWIPGVITASAGIGIAVLQLAFSIIIAGIILANAPGASQTAVALANRLFGQKGPDFIQLAESTVRSVTSGIIGVAVIQSVFAGIGFLVFSLPGAGLWAVIFFAAALFQVGALLLLPAVIYMFAIASTTKAVMFLVWCVIVASLDNVLKPLLLGRGVAVPVAVVFLGAIGGFLALGIMGLFVGAVVLAVGYKLFSAWLDSTAEALN
jgi:predicted PurR-regulated permease PerM